MDLPNETGHAKQNLQPGDHVVRLEPAERQSDVGPYLPGHDECDDEAKEFVCCCFFRHVLAVGMNDANWCCGY